ncbi:MAG: hypothetical protein IKT40_05935 [Bacilli bacterium]|nr:hypothetical protein [Bacilli bacterium]
MKIIENYKDLNDFENGLISFSRRYFKTYSKNYGDLMDYIDYELEIPDQVLIDKVNLMVELGQTIDSTFSLSAFINDINKSERANIHNLAELVKFIKDVYRPYNIISNFVNYFITWSCTYSGFDFYAKLDKKYNESSKFINFIEKIYFN